MKTIIPVAGLGTRLYPITLTTPKPLLKILNKPILQWTLENLYKNNLNDIILVIDSGTNGKLIKKFISSLNLDITVNYAIQKEQLGTAHVLQTTQKFFNKKESFLLLNGDDLYGPNNIKIILQQHLAVIGKEVSDPQKWGIFQSTSNNILKKVIEKPSEPIGNIANIGLYKLNTDIFEIFNQIHKSPRGEYEITDSLNLLAQKTKIHVLKTVDYWIPVGYPWHLFDATELFIDQLPDTRNGIIEKNVIIKGKVILPKNSIIKSGTYIEGNVIIGENCIIGPNAYLRKNVVLDDNSHIGAFVELKNCIIGKNTKIPHLSYLGDSIIGNNVNISANTIAANLRHDNQNVKTIIKNKLIDTGRRKFGTVIGDNTKTGIGTKIYPGRKIWPNNLLLPGKDVNKDVM